MGAGGKERIIRLGMYGLGRERNVSSLGAYALDCNFHIALHFIINQ